MSLRRFPRARRHQAARRKIRNATRDARVRLFLDAAFHKIPSLRTDDLLINRLFEAGSVMRHPCFYWEQKLESTAPG
jgi:hypothetical protein